jgi:DNA-binding transcriptional ArsR family regulator
MAESMQVGFAKPETEIHSALANERRRHVLSILENTGAELSLNELVRKVAERESGNEPGATCDEVEQIRISLYHRHLPKLADVGLVEHDPGEKTVALASGDEADS